MQISLERGSASFSIVAYGDGFVSVNEQRIECSCVVMPERLDVSWPPQSISELDATHTAGLTVDRPEIILLGTGQRQVFPPTEIMAPLIAEGIGFEIMDTRAACRTYNILMAEGRDVLAALMMISA